jgi:proline iminopeptidase
MTTLRLIIGQIIMGGFAVTIGSAFGGDNEAKLTIGSHDVRFADVSLHFVVAGHGPLAIVTSPGWGIGSLYLQRGLAPLEQSFTLLYLDTRGSGESSRPADSKQMTVAAMADDIDRLRSYLGLAVINLVGHSNGAAIALDYAERYPQQVKKVVPIDAEVLDDRAESVTQRFLALWHDDPRFKHAVEAAADDPADDTDEHGVDSVH